MKTDAEVHLMLRERRKGKTQEQAVMNKLLGK
jgi:hypothetical protein